MFSFSHIAEFYLNRAARAYLAFDPYEGRTSYLECRYYLVLVGVFADVEFDL